MLKRHATLFIFLIGILSLGLAWYEFRQQTCGSSFCGQTALGYACTADNRCSVTHPGFALASAIAGLLLAIIAAILFSLRKLSKK